MIDLTVVIPAFNESARLRDGFERLAPALVELGESNVEVIVVDDGSSDDTLRRAHEVYGHLEHALFLQQPTNLGKGAALRLGMGLARGTHVITADADMAIDPQQFSLFTTALRTSDFVPGTRAIKGRIAYGSPLRSLAGSVFHHFVHHYTHTAQRDTQCGCKGFELGTARLLASLAMVDRFAFDVELFYLADLLDLRVSPLLVTWRDVPGSSVRPVHDSLVMLRDVRGIRTTRYENIAVVLSPEVRVDEITPVAREARLQGLVLARGEQNSLLVVGRNGGPGALGVAKVLGGQLRTTNLAELRSRTYEAI
ncbi:MAG TPA: glycosyltransferase [Acidimicrobiales bacterium]|nr:glycosyltransferase [Acidimicrobiales bacterium]